MYTTKEETQNWLNKYEIQNYTINYDLTVDVNDDVWLYGQHLTEIPIQFNNVAGFFSIVDNNLMSLKGSPKITNGFSCDENINLKSLEYLPIIRGNFYCDDNLKESIEYKRWKLMNSLIK